MEMCALRQNFQNRPRPGHEARHEALSISGKPLCCLVVSQPKRHGTRSPAPPITSRLPLRVNPARGRFASFSPPPRSLPRIHTSPVPPSPFQGPGTSRNWPGKIERVPGDLFMYVSYEISNTMYFTNTLHPLYDDRKAVLDRWTKSGPPIIVAWNK